MDGRVAELKEKLDRSLKVTAELAAELQGIDGSQQTVPHYSQIENAAHQVGVELSCRIQACRSNEVASAAGTQANCPECGEVCDLKNTQRPVESIDGPVDVLEPVARCSRCRRDFFPSTHETGLGQS